MCPLYHLLIAQSFGNFCYLKKCGKNILEKIVLRERTCRLAIKDIKMNLFTRTHCSHQFNYDFRKRLVSTISGSVLSIVVCLAYNLVLLSNVTRIK